MIKVKVSLQPIISKINLPTVLKTTILPGDSIERLFIATQVGEIFYIGNGVIRTFLDIRPRIIKLGVFGGGYDERGLLGLAFHPEFYYNGLFYLHYSVAGTQGPGALPEPFKPNPCDPRTLNLKWINRETQYDHIDTVEEWILQSNGQPQKRRTLLNLRRPFLNHNGVNSLNFSPETGKLVLTTGDGGSGYDPFNLSQDDMEIAGKIIEIDVVKNTFVYNPPVVTRFNELPAPIQETLTVIAKGVRNIPGISFQRFYNQYIKYVGNVGQDLVESIFSFVHYKPIPVTQLIQASLMTSEPDQEGFINFGWRGWEGAFPASIISGCSVNPTLNEKTIAYYNEAVKTSVKRLQPLTSYFHKDPRPDKFGGTALTGVQPYMGNGIPDLTGSVVFTDLAQDEESQPPVRGVLAYTRVRTDCKLNDFSVIETDYNFGSQSAYYVSLGTNLDQTRLYLGVHGSMKVTDFNQGTVFEIVP
ncbi:PQQ-dependent sugar dehydrogenase [Aneurinibacillus sp. Ricciae_BoGa-3]|uniref:PQQ-dependent sugar dehydrogenase n=1 Tax=Aneurinibacillus sp. Ricciae_BoGa-3 TaxID=3022697 RepID=UPI002340B27D|nr:PQQ-dependent sugar dehydrogenase [Aneurinibacillus sp. Ricciae_BoGa-3]WCK55096.1 PQQ-dependent sugar dehydrogenase [Aneurinibacillus sp. Ricciae_BoGa-3]